ncbi:replication protein A 70 kDa DNA-binding subunit C-like protein [Tanacetum coccineum]
MSTESVGTKPDRKAAGMDEYSPMKPQEKMSAKSGVTKSDSKGVGMAESSHTTPPKKMSIKSRGTTSVSKAAGMAESSQTKPHLFLDELEVDVTGTIVVMIGRVWDVNDVTGRYLSTDLVVSDSRGNMIHCTPKASIAHNFLRLKEGDIYSIKNFVVLPNKDEYRIFKHDKIMLEFDGETTVRKVSVNGLGFLIYPFQLIDFDRIEPANNKCNRGQSLRVTLWGGLGDALIKRKTKHVGMCAIVLTSVSPKTYNNKLYLSSTSSTIIYDNDDIPCLQELKTSESFVEQKKEGLAINASRPREGTLENLSIWPWNRKNDTAIFNCKVMIENFRTKKGWNYPSCGSEKCRKGVTRQNGQFICEACNKAIDYPVFRYMLEVVVADDTAHTVVVMFNDTVTKLLKCSAKSLLGAGEDEDDESSLPTAIRNLIGITHVLEIKSHTYYEYGTFESFTCWKINPSEMVDDGASSSSQLLSADNPTPAMKRLSRHPFICTHCKPTKEKKKRRADLEDSDVDETSGSVKDSDKCNADGALDKKKKKRYIAEDYETE